MLEHFHPLENVERLGDGYRRCVEVAGHNLLLVCTEGELFLIENRCPHMDWPLDSGEIKNRTIVCAKHRIQFDLRTGLAFAPGSLEPLTRYEVVVVDGQAGIDLRQLS